MQIYINVWRDKKSGDVWFEQQTIKNHVGLNGSLVNAMDDYNLMGTRHNFYEHTLLIDTTKKTSAVFDITPLVEEYNKGESAECQML
jgi:hypothetical protein